jgi:hypothetical protein
MASDNNGLLPGKYRVYRSGGPCAINFVNCSYALYEETFWSGTVHCYDDFT